MKHRDAIIEDLHKLRARIGRAHGFDVDRIAATIRQHERESGASRVAPSGRRKKAVATVRARKRARPRVRAVGT
jgi:hypothetical protein